MPEREWVSIRDPNDDHVRHTFDVSFLLSGYRCIYGMGCPGIRQKEPDPVVGCCEHGAYYTDDADRERIEELVSEVLDDEVMQHHALAIAHGVTDEDDDREAHTRVVNGACVFLNRDGWSAGTGCALHILADRRGEHHMTYKPEVCWQLPLHRDIREEVANDGDTLEVHTIAPFERGTWGAGGADFSWWCTEDPDAFVAEEPVYERMAPELRGMVGDAVYEELASFLDERRATNHVTFLPLTAPAT